MNTLKKDVKHQCKGFTLIDLLIIIGIISIILIVVYAQVKEYKRQSQSEKTADELPSIVYEALDLMDESSRNFEKNLGFKNPINSDDSQIKFHKELLQQRPQDPKIQVGLAFSYQLNRDFRNALKYYLLARENAPDAADPLIGLGRLCYDLAFVGVLHDSSNPLSLNFDEKGLQLLRIAREELLAAKTKTIFLGFFSPHTIDEFLEMIYNNFNNTGISFWKNQNYEAAVSVWREAAEGEESLSQLHLAIAYLQGNGVAKDFEKAAFWCQKAADQNLPEAQYRLASMYLIGKGVSEDQAKALYWFRKAAEQDHQKAQEAVDILEKQVPAKEDNFVNKSGNVNADLLEAVKRGNVEVTQTAIQAGADIDDNSSGTIALIVATQKGYTHIVKLLLKHNADTNVNAGKGFTALMNAAYYGHTDIVKILIAYGADINTQEPNGQTALSLAKKKGHEEIVRLLEKPVPKKIAQQPMPDAESRPGYDINKDIGKKLLAEFITIELTSLSVFLKGNGFSEEQVKELMNSKDFVNVLGNETRKLLEEWGPDIARLRLNPVKMPKDMHTALKSFRAKIREEVKKTDRF